MAKIQVNLKLSKDTVELLNKLAKQTSLTKVAVVENALRLYEEHLNKDLDKVEKDVELLSEQNDQLQIALSTFKVVLESKDNELKTLKELVKDKDERIQELKETIKIIKEHQEKNKSWWKFW